MALGGIVKGKRTTLRPPTEDDLPAYARWMADMRVRHAGSVWHQPAMPATWKERLTEQAKDHRGVLWSIEGNAKVVGLVSARIGGVEGGPNADIQHFIIDPEEWRKGYGWDAALALHRYFFDYLDLKRVSTEVRADNAAALRIAAKLGYAEYARGHQVHYRDGGYVDESSILMERAAWDERFGTTEREYVPFGAAR